MGVWSFTDTVKPPKGASIDQTKVDGVYELNTKIYCEKINVRFQAAAAQRRWAWSMAALGRSCKSLTESASPTKYTLWECGRNQIYGLKIRSKTESYNVKMLWDFHIRRGCSYLLLAF